MLPKRTIFITGTDTGVGKTVLTALLLLYLRQRRIEAVATKPFCSGSRDDVRLLQSIQPGKLTDTEMNPFFFRKAVAPLAARADLHKRISLKGVIEKIKKVQKQADLLLIEGAGGLMVPVATNVFVVDVIAALQCEVMLVCRNQLGTLNHTLLSVEAMKKRGVQRMKIVLMDTGRRDASTRTNEQMLRALLPNNAIFHLPFSREKPNEIAVLMRLLKKNEKTLAQMLVDN